MHVPHRYSGTRRYALMIVTVIMMMVMFVFHGDESCVCGLAGAPLAADSHLRQELSDVVASATQVHGYDAGVVTFARSLGKQLA